MRIVILICSLLFIASCSTEAPKLKLNKDERTFIDSMYSQQIPVLDSLMDSICLDFRKRDYQRIKDSLIDIRIKEIEAIKN
jgi:PBP1b-binding outer membrane lipoprotein LpoB